MTKARELLDTRPNELTLDSGVVVRIKPFPAGLYQALATKAAKLHPTPEPPKRQVEVVDGFEEVDDFDDPVYVTAKAEAEKARAELLAEAVLDFCVDVDASQYQSEIARLGKYADLPADPNELRVAFLELYALRTKRDYARVMASATEQVLVDDAEVEQRLENFRGQVERAKGNGATPSGADEGVGLGVQQPGA